MGQTTSAKARAERLRGWVFLVVWAGLIVSGIVAKRVYGHPDMMVFFHLPAAVFLVMAAHALSGDVRRRYRESLVGAGRRPMVRNANSENSLV
jgi:hypothetical protein